MIIENPIATAIKEALFEKNWIALSDLALAIKTSSPHCDLGWRLSALAAQESGSCAEASAALDDLWLRFPSTGSKIREEGWKAYYDGDLPLATLLWRMGLANFSDDAEMPHGLALALRAANKWGSSDAVLAAGVERFPAAIPLRIDQGWNAIQAQRWAEAVEVWRGILTRNPECLAAWHGGSIALRGLGDFDAAEALLTDAMQRFPDEPLFACEYAGVASQRLDWLEACRRWELVRARFPDAQQGLVSGGAALLRAGLNPYADRVLSAAVSRHPENVQASVDHVHAALRCHELRNAMARCELALKRFPDRADLHALLTNIRLRLGDLGGTETAIDTGLQGFPDDGGLQLMRGRLDAQRLASEQPAPVAADNHSALMLEFESLGANCEFGIVQRHFGAEPLGLFRFTGISAANLATALDDDLRGIGGPEFTYLAVAPNGEYLVRDTRYYMNSHTFHRQGAIDHERLLAGQCRKIAFMAGKFIEGLRDEPKIYVFRDADPVPDAVMNSLLRALRRHGDATLLWVRTVFGDEHEPPAGSVERRGPNLFVGHVSRLGQLADGTANTDHDEWLGICRSVWAQMQS